jgi:hypothetical protein
VRIAILLVFVVGSGLASTFLTRDRGVAAFGNGVPALVVMLALVGLITFFGFLSLPIDGQPVNRLTDSAVRTALTAALVMTYLVYFSTAVWLSEGEGVDAARANDLLSTLTSMIMVVLPFYFGVTGAVEAARIWRAPAAEDRPESR